MRHIRSRAAIPFLHVQMFRVHTVCFTSFPRTFDVMLVSEKPWLQDWHACAPGFLQSFRLTWGQSASRRESTRAENSQRISLALLTHDHVYVYHTSCPEDNYFVDKPPDGYDPMSWTWTWNCHCSPAKTLFHQRSRVSQVQNSKFCFTSRHHRHKPLAQSETETPTL